MNEKVTTIFKTDNYGKFKFLPENRELNKASLKRIGKSIDDNGFLLNPIKVNERFEIIDGQHRFEALKERSMPIIYFIAEGADAKSCRILNSNQRNWTVSDYIHTYSESGYEAYKWLSALTKKHPDIALIGIMASIDMTGVAARNTKALREGRFTMTESDYNKTIKRLEFYVKANEAMQSKSGFARLDYKCGVLSFCYEHKAVNNKRLLEKIAANWNRPDMLNPCVTLEQCVAEISKIYNYRNREKLLIDYEYKKWRMERTGGLVN